MSRAAIYRDSSLRGRASSCVGNWLVRIEAAFALFLTVALVSAACSSLALAAEIKSESFTLVPGAPSKATEFAVNQPARIRVEVTSDAVKQSFTLTVQPISAGAANRVSRASGTGHVAVDTEITAQDLSTYGRRWVATIAVSGLFVGSGPTAGSVVTGRLVVTDGSGANAPPPPPPSTSTPPPSGAVAPPPAPRVGYLPPPPTTASPPPPSASALPPVPPPPSAQAVRSGRFRVTLLGAIAYGQTRDAGSAVATVAASDSIFLVTDILEMTARGAETPMRRRTPTYGNTANVPGNLAPRIRLGSAGADGGIKTGDAMPYAQPWIRKVPIATDRLPHVVWEGNLIDGLNTVLIAPTVWEEDDGSWTVGRFRNFSASAVHMSRLMLADLPPSAELFKIINDIARTKGALLALPELLNAPAISRFTAAVGGGSVTRAAAAGLTPVGAGDRPIGLTYRSGQQVFVPKVLILNLATAERLLATSQPPVPVPNIFGSAAAPVPSGVVNVRYVDGEQLGGDYEMFFQIERVR